MLKRIITVIILSSFVIRHSSLAETTITGPGSLPSATPTLSDEVVFINGSGASAKLKRATFTTLSGILGGGLTIGTSSITSGTSGNVLYDNGGTLGELGKSPGGANTLDNGKLVTFGSDGSINVSSSSGAGLVSTVQSTATAGIGVTLSGATTAKGVYVQQLSSGESGFYATGSSAANGIVLNNGASDTFAVGMDGTITAGTWQGSPIAMAKLAVDPLARANHTGTQTLSTISDAGTFASKNTASAVNMTGGSFVWNTSALIISEAGITLPDGDITAAHFDGDGAAITGIDAANIASGTAVVGVGGTGRTSSTAYAVICGGTTSTGAQQSVVSVGTSGQVLTSNGAGALPTFQTAPSSGITIGMTTTSGASANDILISDGTVVQKITPGTGVAPALGNAVNGASGLLTYGLIGTSGTKIPLLDDVNTWSANQVVNATLYALNVTSTNNVTATNYVFSSASGVIAWGGESQVQRYGTASWKWNYDQNAANPTDVIHKSASGITGTDRNGADFIIESGDSTGTGTSDIIFKTPTAGSTGTTARVAAEKFRVNSTAVTASVPVKPPSYIVSGLPTASTVGAGSMAFVTDATSTTTYTTVSGGGANKVLVISDGTNWIIH